MLILVVLIPLLFTAVAVEHTQAQTPPEKLSDRPCPEHMHMAHEHHHKGHKSDHRKHLVLGKHENSKPENSPSTAAYEQSMQTMHHDMMIDYTGDADVDFVAGMIPHHQGAVEMAQVELKYGHDKQMRGLAKRIIKWQESEIGFMTSWLRGRASNYRAPDVDAMPSTNAFKDSMQKMHSAMMVPYTGDADADFARGMIPHHQGAVDMAVILKKYGQSPELSKFADEIIRGQGQEIAQMKTWLEKHPAPQAHTPLENPHKKSKHS